MDPPGPWNTNRSLKYQLLCSHQCCLLHQQLLSPLCSNPKSILSSSFFSIHTFSLSAYHFSLLLTINFLMMMMTMMMPSQPPPWSFPLHRTFLLIRCSITQVSTVSELTSLSCSWSSSWVNMPSKITEVHIFLYLHSLNVYYTVCNSQTHQLTSFLSNYTGNIANITSPDKLFSPFIPILPISLRSNQRKKTCTVRALPWPSCAHQLDAKLKFVSQSFQHCISGNYYQSNGNGSQIKIYYLIT